MKTFILVSLLALYVIFVGAFTLWRSAESWEGMSFGRRVFLAMSVSWKWWLLFSVALLVFDAVIYHRRRIAGELIVAGLAISMAVIFARQRSAELRRSQLKKKS
jgi:hypothetical protein